MSLSDEELERYARHIVLPQVGGVGQARLKASSVAVVGAGGIGAAVIPSLAAAGVGRLTIIDDGRVELSNLQRQLIFSTDHIGHPKAPLAAAHVRAINPTVEAQACEDRIGPANAAALLGGHALVIDGSDNFATRLAVSDATVALRLPLVSAAAAQFQGQVALWRGWEPDLPCYRCFVGDAFDSDDCDSCAELGVMGAMVATVGHFAALLSIKHVVGFGDDAVGRIHLFDGLSLEWRHVRVPVDRNCRTCGVGHAANPRP